MVKALGIGLLLLGCCVGCSSTSPSGDGSTPTIGSSHVCAGPDPLLVTTTFVRAVEAHDRDTYLECEDTSLHIDASTTDSVANGDWLLEKAALGVGTDPAIGTVVYAIPTPPIPAGTVTDGTSVIRLPAHACGIRVTTRRESDNSYRVTAVALYCSA